MNSYGRTFRVEVTSNPPISTKCCERKFRAPAGATKINGLQEGRGDLLFVKESSLPWMREWLRRQSYTYLILLVYFALCRIVPHQFHIGNDIDGKGLEGLKG